MIASVRKWAADRRGAMAIEYAFVLPAFAMLLMGAINTAAMAGAVSGMHFAVEEAARCSAVNKVTCASSSAVISYARGKYNGPDIGPVFTSTADGCGHTVRATATFELNIAVAVLDVPLSAAACYPGSSINT